MSEERSQVNPAATRITTPDLRLSAGAEEGIQPPPAERSVTATPPAVGAGDPAGLDGPVPVLLVALLQEYALHHGRIAKFQRTGGAALITVLLLSVGGGLVFAVCVIWMVIKRLAGLSATPQPGRDPLLVGMWAGGFIALYTGFMGWGIFRDERQRVAAVAAAEAGRADVVRRLLAAFPQLQGVSAEALLSGKAAQGIMTRPANWPV